MNNFFFMFCTEEAAPITEGNSMQSLILQYVIYGAIIILGIFVLMLIRKKTKLPTHQELSRRLMTLSASLDTLVQHSSDESENGYDFLRGINKHIYMTDKLIYVITLVAEKERDTGFSAIAQKLEKSKEQLQPYKLSVKAKHDLQGLSDAKAELNGAIESLNQILDRDRELKAKRAKRNNG